jgi:hypothetical protein
VQNKGGAAGSRLLASAVVLLLLLGVAATAILFASPTSSAKAAKSPPPCQAAFPNARAKTIGKTTWYNRQESVRMVICGGFGLEPSADFPVSASMVCGLLSQAIGKGSDKLGIYADGTCSAADLASDPKEPVKYLSAACSWGSDLVGIAIKPLGTLLGLGCTLAPSAGHALGGVFESKHELDVARDVMNEGKCIKYSPTHFGSPWVTEACADGDKGFTTLPVHRPGPSTQPTPASPGPTTPPPTGPAGGSPGSPSGGGTTSNYEGLPVTQVSIASEIACALQVNGIPYCWGNRGGYDYGATSPPHEAMIEITTGEEFGCGLRTDKTVVCWGWEAWPIKADIPSGTFVQVTSGLENVCGLRASGEAVCWGSNMEGQSDPPAGPFTRLSGGGETTCGLRSTGAIDCWGWNNYGQAEPPTGTFTAISTGVFNGCAIRADATVACWGRDDNRESTPPAGSFSQVSAGEGDSCGVRLDHKLLCWGLIDTAEVEALPTQYEQVSAGVWVFCAVTTSAGVSCGGMGGEDPWGIEDPPG